MRVKNDMQKSWVKFKFDEEKYTTCSVCNAISSGVSLCCVSINGLLGLKSTLSLHAVISGNSVKQYINYTLYILALQFHIYLFFNSPSLLPLKESTLNGTRNSFITVFTLCVPIVILYEYFTACPLYEGGASLGIVSR